MKIGVTQSARMETILGKAPNLLELFTHMYLIPCKNRELDCFENMSRN